MMFDRWFRAFAVALLSSIALFALTVERSRGPAPKSADAPAHEFSAARARAILERILGDGAPHPVGSAANRRVRDAIVSELRRAGHAPVVDRRWECHGWADCAEVENVLVRIEGSSGREAVLVAAHYDSVGSGPGASDDGQGVAALLEIARMLKGERFRNPIIFLWSDGEEAGLIGAAAFLRQHPWAKEVAAVVNLEARGTSGASYLFETSRNNRALIELAAENIPHPATSSLYYSIYERLPNDTDFTVFKSAGVAGVNFAYVGDVQHYHTPRDNVANASPRSLQHHGENALAMTRALANGVPRGVRGNAVFFDVFSLTVIRWPEAWTLGLLLLDVVLLVVASAIVRKRHGLAMRQLLWGIVFAIVALVLAVALAVAGSVVLRAPSPWVAHPAALLTFFWVAGLVASGLVATLLARRAGAWGLWCGAAFVWTALGAILFAVLSGGVFLFLVPSLLMNVCGLAFAERGETLAFVIPSVVAAAIVFPTAWPLYAGMGLQMMLVVTFLVAAATLPLAALLAHAARRPRAITLGAFTAIAIASLAIAIALPPYSDERPRRLSLLLHNAQWLIPGDEAPLPPAVARAAAWRSERVNPFPWFPARGYFAAPAPPPSRPLPGVATEREGNILRIRITPRGEPSKVALMLRNPQSIESVTVNGRTTTPESGRRGIRSRAWLRITLHTVPAHGIAIELVQRNAAPVDAVIEQRWYGVPAAASNITGARGASNVPSQEGDVTIATGRVRL